MSGYIGFWVILSNRFFRSGPYGYDGNQTAQNYHKLEKVLELQIHKTEEK